MVKEKTNILTMYALNNVHSVGSGCPVLWFDIRLTATKHRPRLLLSAYPLSANAG